MTDALGDDVRMLSGATSNMTSQSIINGRVTKQSTVTYNVQGSTGRAATARVSTQNILSLSKINRHELFASLTSCILLWSTRIFAICCYIEHDSAVQAL